jgi:hypothetical protein
MSEERPKPDLERDPDNPEEIGSACNRLRKHSEDVIRTITSDSCIEFPRSAQSTERSTSGPLVDCLAGTDRRRRHPSKAQEYRWNSVENLDTGESLPRITTDEFKQSSDSMINSL